MRRVLLVFAFAALLAGCGVSSPVAPDDSGSLTPAEECTDTDQSPC